MTTLPLRKSIGRSPLRLAFLLIRSCSPALRFCQERKRLRPTPDGGYLGANTAEGGPDALFSLTTGTDNTADGFRHSLGLTMGSQNTAVGAASAL